MRLRGGRATTSDLGDVAADSSLAGNRRAIRNRDPGTAGVEVAFLAALALSPAHLADHWRITARALHVRHRVHVGSTRLVAPALPAAGHPARGVLVFGRRLLLFNAPLVAAIPSHLCAVLSRWHSHLESVPRTS